MKVESSNSKYQTKTLYEHIPKMVASLAEIKNTPIITKFRIVLAKGSNLRDL